MTIPIQLFIDLPNILFDEHGPAYCSLPTILGHIDDHSLEGGELKRADIYSFSYNLVHKLNKPHVAFNGIIEEVENYDYSLRNQTVYIKRADKQKDVDVYITNDIWRSCVHFSHRKSKAVRHILVSGDSDYARTYKDIAQEFMGTLAVDVHVYSWKANCSPRMKTLGSLTYLDDLDGIRDPMPESVA